MSTDRRSAIKNIVAGTAALSTIGAFANMDAVAQPLQKNMPLKGNINHSACRWCYQDIPLDKLCIEGKRIGLSAIDLVGPKEWDTLKAHGIHSSMCNGAEINLVDGFNDKQFHARLIKQYSEMIPLVAKAGYTNLICFSGNKRNKSDEEGWANCAEGLKQLMPLAEKHKVVLVMELLNSKLNHQDYQADRTWWGAELCKKVGSESFKLLYDIYHMQIDEGDVITNIKQYHPYIAHYHTGGVPGRHEIDETQELFYPAIMNAIVATGFKGYVAQEFVPTGDNKLKSLQKCVQICDV
ncbi:hydroxypyruvate isomerase family protein [Mucilaginibacter aquatilis]|uniref:TIM barrel protein n=1 Tax=Mucilaginibacter aquatilis TaxID=1517760 RepID=A0A6I4IQH9_9SPHI|nr:sugar phosphate isomerase/epimerase family protein [Mucilaginibacter aquatilis]MVN91733.1 TIM barrel protein [Mucilaginibacter aquatilis]